MGLPQIDIIFIQKAVTAIKRSKRGVTVVILEDGTQEKAGVDIFKFSRDITNKKYTNENVEILKRCFLVEVNKLYVLHVPTGTTWEDISKMLDKVKYNYACTTKEEWQAELVSYTLQRNKQSKGKKYVAFVYNVTVADNRNIINVKNQSVTMADNDKVVPMVQYLPRLTSIIANLPMNRSCTYYVLEDLKEADVSFIDTEHDADSWIDKGWFILINDDDETVKVGRGVNSLTTYTSTDTEDMSKIIISESMNLILEDIYSTFKNYWVGKYKNKLNNQYLFISAVNTYFRSLTTVENGEILDEEFDNIAYIDTEKQRQDWLGIGKTEAEDWDDEKIKKMTFKSFLNLAGDIKILDAIEDLHFSITME